MFKLISSKNILVNILILIISAILTFNFKSEVTVEIQSVFLAVFYKFLFHFITSVGSLPIYQLTCFVFLTLNTYLFSNLSFFLRIAKQRNMFYGFIFLFLNGIVLPYIKDPLPVLISLSLFMIMLRMLFGIFRKQNILFNLFNIGFIISIASFFWYYSSWLFPFIFFAIIILRTPDIREWIVPVTGLVLPYFLLISVYFLIYGNFDIIFNLFEILHFKESIPHYDLAAIISVCFLSLILLSATFKIALKYRTLEADTQDYYRLFFILFLLTVVVFTIYPGMRFSIILFALVPITVPVALLISESKRNYVKEIITDLLILSVIWTQTGYF